MITAERWAELYRLEFPRVYRALLAVLRDRDRALDALHNAFVAGLRHPPGHDADLAGWLFVVAVRSARRGLRLPSLPLERLRGRSGNDEIGAILDRMEVGRLLAGLSERQRAMVVAQFYLCLDHREIARHFGVKTGTVSATLAQAKARMRAGRCEMLPELGIERIFRREIDSLPLPPESLWVPDRQTARRSIPLTALVISATVVLVLGAVVTAREAGDAAATGRRGVTAPLQNVPRPTCLRGGCNVYRSDAFGYGIVLPEDWRVAPPLHGRTPPAGALDRVEFTGQKSDEWTMAFGGDLTIPWDVVVEVYERRGTLAMDWARGDGCGANPCVTGQTTIGGSPAYAASWPISVSLRMHAYYLERGERMLILRYVTGPGSEGPHGVTERTLEQIVGSIVLD